MATNEAHHRKSLGYQFNLAVESTVDEIMDKDEQQLGKGKETTDRQVIVYEEINIVDIEEQQQLLTMYAIQAEKPIYVKEVWENSTAGIEHKEIQSDE